MSAEIVVSDGRVCVRRMTGTDAEYALMARWLGQPHVRQWWDPDGPPPATDSVRRDYGEHITPDSQSVVCFIEDRRRPVGFVQFYPWSAETDYMRRVGISVEPTAWAFDVFIGEPDALGAGVATRALDLLCRHLLAERGASAVVIITEVDNLRAHRVYERIGFRTAGEFLDEDTRDGERVRSYIMRRDP